VVVAVSAACRTTRPAADETPIPPLTSTSAAEAAQQLAARRAAFTGERGLMRIRATSGDQTQSFRAQLQLDRTGRMLLTAYTPIGTTAIRLFTDGREVTFINDLEGTWWRGDAADFSRSFGFFGSLDPSAMAMLIDGLPPDSSAVVVEYAPTGIARASVGDAVVSFDPPVYPPKHVVVSRGAQQLELQHLESAMTAQPVVPPEVPRDYRCCVPPAL
jgi:hypothetical protein